MSDGNKYLQKLARSMGITLPPDATRRQINELVLASTVIPPDIRAAAREYDMSLPPGITFGQARVLVSLRVITVRKFARDVVLQRPDGFIRISQVRDNGQVHTFRVKSTEGVWSKISNGQVRHFAVNLRHAPIVP